MNFQLSDQTKTGSTLGPVFFIPDPGYWSLDAGCFWISLLVDA